MKKVKNGFTLIELLVAIVVLTLIILATSKVNFNQHINSQKAIEFTNSIYTKMENIRNESLMGKAVGTNVVFPSDRKITLNATTFKSTYSTGGTDIDIDNITFQANQSINSHTITEDIINKRPKCITITGTSNNLNLPITLTYINDKITSNPTCIGTIKFQTKYKSIVNEISLNTITGVMEQEKK